MKRVLVCAAALALVAGGSQSSPSLDMPSQVVHHSELSAISGERSAEEFGVPVAEETATEFYEVAGRKRGGKGKGGKGGGFKGGNGRNLDRHAGKPGRPGDPGGLRGGEGVRHQRHDYHDVDIDRDVDIDVDYDDNDDVGEAIVGGIIGVGIGMAIANSNDPDYVCQDSDGDGECDY